MYSKTYHFICRVCSSILKNTVRSSEANITKNHRALISKAALFLLRAGQVVEQEISGASVSSHTVRSSGFDVNRMTETIMNACLHIEVPRRRIEGGSFADPRRVGLLKKEEGWLRSFLGSDISIEEDEVERVDVTRAIEDPDEYLCFDLLDRLVALKKAGLRS